MNTETQPIEDTLLERVNKLVQALDRPLEWGNPLVSITPRAHAIRDLALRTEALENAVREIAFEVQKLTSAANKDS